MMNRTKHAIPAARAAAAVLLLAAALWRPETVLLPAGGGLHQIATSEDMQLITESQPVLLESSGGYVSLPSLRPGSHLLRSSGMPGWQRVQSGEGPDRLQLGTNLAAAAAAAAAAALLVLLTLRRQRRSYGLGLLLAGAGAMTGNPSAVIAASATMGARSSAAVAGSALSAALITAPWLPLNLTLPLAIAAGVYGLTPRRAPLPLMLLMAGALLAPVATYIGDRVETGALDDCLEYVEEDRTRMLQCVETHMTMLGSQKRLQDGREELRAALEKEATGGGSWCRIGEESLTEAHVLAGGEWESFLAEGALCDFSLQHGIGSALGWAVHQPEEVARSVCRIREGLELAPNMQLSQCWHGIGQGAARRRGWDIAGAAEICYRAEGFGSNSNCAEGATFAGLTRELVSGRQVSPISLDACLSLGGAGEVGACVRYLPERSYVKEGWEVAVQEMRSICASKDDIPGCWASVGSYMGRGLEREEDVSGRLPQCRGGIGTLEEDCVVSYFSLAATSSVGSDVSFLLSLLDAADLERMGERAEAAIEEHVGKSSG